MSYNAILVPCNLKTKYCADFTEVYKERLTIEQYIPDVFVKSSYCKYLKRNKIRIWHVKYELWNCELAGAAGQLGIQLTRQTPHLPQYTASGEDEDEAWPDHFQAAKFAWLAMCKLSPWRRPQCQCGRDVSLCCLSLQQLLSPQSAANILLTGSGRCLVTDSLQSLVIIVITFQTDITHFTSPHCTIFPAEEDGEKPEQVGTRGPQWSEGQHQLLRRGDSRMVHGLQERLSQWETLYRRI